MQHKPKITALTLTLSGFIFSESGGGKKIQLTDNLTCILSHLLKDEVIAIYRVFFNDTTEIGLLKMPAGEGSALVHHQLSFYEDCLYSHCTNDFFLTLLAGLYKEKICVRITTLHLGTFTNASFGLNVATAYQEAHGYLPIIKRLPRSIYRSGNLYVGIKTMSYNLPGISEYLYSCGLGEEYKVTAIEVRPTQSVLKKLAPVDLTVTERLEDMYLKEAIPFEKDIATLYNEVTF